MLAPDVRFMVHSSEVIDQEGYAHRGSKITTVEGGAAAEATPQWRARDFAFAGYRGCTAQGLREVGLGELSFWAFACAREHCEEIVVFRKGADTRKRWDEDDLIAEDPKAWLGMFFIMRAAQLTTETPLCKQFNGEWGFWETFFVPVLDENHTMQALSLMDPCMAEEFFVPRCLPVTRHRCPEGGRVLTIPDDTYVTYEVKAVCKDMFQWTDLVNKIGDDMIMQDHCIIEHKHLKPGDECLEAYYEHTGIEEHARLIKRDLEQLKLPIIATFKCRLRVVDWDEDMISLQYKYDALNQVYTSNLMGGFSSMSGAKADPWNPVARLAVAALTKLLARYPEIQNLVDIGCGDMAWMRHFLRANPALSYVGVDIMPHCLAMNSKRFPRLSFVQTDLSNLSGVEVIPTGCDLMLGKDVFNHMTLPDAVAAVRRCVGAKPRFLLTHVHAASDNTGWERRIDKHLHYTRYDYSKAPFSLPFPATEIQRISDEAYFVLYEISPEGAVGAPPRTAQLRPPARPDVGKGKPCGFGLVASGEWAEPPQLAVPAAGRPAPDAKPEAASGAALAPVGERTQLNAPVTKLEDRPVEEGKVAQRREIKGLPAVEFRARCDTIFERFDAAKEGCLRFEQVAALMGAGGRAVDSVEAYEGLCRRLDCDAAAGLARKDLHRFFEKAPLPLWDALCAAVDPLAGCVVRGAASLPEARLEKPIQEFIFEDGEPYARLHIEVNSHMYYGAAEDLSIDRVQAFFSEKRVEVHISVPSAFGAGDDCRWKLVVSPTTGEIVPDDCSLEVKDTEGRFGGRRVTVCMMKAAKRRWHKIGQVTTAVKA